MIPHPAPSPRRTPAVGRRRPPGESAGPRPEDPHRGPPATGRRRPVPRRRLRRPGDRRGAAPPLRVGPPRKVPGPGRGAAPGPGGGVRPLRQRGRPAPPGPREGRVPGDHGGVRRRRREGPGPWDGPRDPRPRRGPDPLPPARRCGAPRAPRDPGGRAWGGPRLRLGRAGPRAGRPARAEPPVQVGDGSNGKVIGSRVGRAPGPGGPSRRNLAVGCQPSKLTTRVRIGGRPAAELPAPASRSARAPSADSLSAGATLSGSGAEVA